MQRCNTVNDGEAKHEVIGGRNNILAIIRKIVKQSVVMVQAKTDKIYIIDSDSAPIMVAI